MSKITTLIDKDDVNEIVRDQIAAILAVESVEQVVLAAAAGKPEPDDWKLRVFTERANPWEQWHNFKDGVTDESPVVNVWFSDETFDKKGSDIFERQVADGVFNIDVYAGTISRDDASGGHKPGDREAALIVQRGARLCRNIMMAAIYLRLDLPIVVSDRWAQSITVFQPEIEDVPIQHVIAARLAMEVRYNEFSPQIELETLELLSSVISRDGDGMLHVLADIAYP